MAELAMDCAKLDSPVVRYPMDPNAPSSATCLQGRANGTASVVFTAQVRCEADFQPPLSSQNFLLPAKRMRVVNWLAEIAFKLLLMAETLCLAVNYYDRTIAALIDDPTTPQSVPAGGDSPFSQRRLCLLGLGCLLVAAKFEEKRVPAMKDWHYISSKVFPVEDILDTEERVLSLLEWRLAAVTARSLLRPLLNEHMETVDSRVLFMAEYLSELALVEPELMRFRPSMVAAACCMLAMYHAPCRLRHGVSTLSADGTMILPARFGPYSTGCEDFLNCVRALSSAHVLFSDPANKEANAIRHK